MNSGLLTTDFEGVSGGSLWQINIARDADGNWHKYGPFALEGCAFYQTGLKGERLYVRFHGRRSIYGHGLDKLLSNTKGPANSAMQASAKSAPPGRGRWEEIR